MHPKKPEQIKSSEITDRRVYLNRRLFMRGAALVASTAATGLLYKQLLAPTPRADPPALQNAAQRDWGLPGDPATPYESITTYNNFYEFTTTKEEVWEKAEGFATRPWAVEVGGLVNKPQTFDIDDLIRLAPQEDRIYRFRCVEGWSMVIPWLGFPLAELLRRVEPLSNATHVAFQTLLDPKRMPGQRSRVLDWPYVEGLRMDEAMHPLTILATGLYGEPLPPQDGAPVRLVVPWKYGYKSIKSVVKITLTDRQPPTTWNLAVPSYYGFYSNVNPEWNEGLRNQASERRIGEWGLRKTLMFNGYADQVAHLYAGMDLRKNY
jgi:sulfoxide reductase catalytic subunit YedY